MSELKPCPFCGGKAMIYGCTVDVFGIGPKDFTVYCYECRASVMHFYATENGAIDAWNRRDGNER